MALIWKIWIAIFVIAIFAFVVVPIGIYIAGVIIQWLGRLGKFFATLPQPGKMMFVMVGGRFERTVENVIDFDLGPDGQFVSSPRKRNRDFRFFETHYGVTWIGLFGEVKIFPKWQWMEFRQKKDDQGNLLPELDVITREGDVREFLHQFTFSVPTNDIELSGNDKASTKSLVTVLIMDPEKAFFQNKNWVETLSGFIQSLIKDWASDKNLERVKELSRGDQRRSDLTRVILEANQTYQYEDPETGETRDGGFRKILGVVVVSHFLQSIEATGPVAAAQSKQREAELLGDAKITEATKAGEAAIIKAEKEASALDMLAAAKQRYIDQTIVQPCSGENGERIAEILKAQALADKDSKITTFVERGGGAIPSIPVK